MTIRITTAACAGLAVLLLMPLITNAQIKSELETAIWGSLLADPRSASVPPEEMAQLVNALVEQAEAQNITAGDILWRPQSESVVAAVGATQRECATGWQGYLCNFNMAFGFSGTNYEIPIILLVTSALLLVIIWELIAHHRKMLAKAGKPMPWENMPH